MIDVSALEAYTGQIAEAAAMSGAASAKQHHYIHGDADSDVITESGPVPTIAKQARLSAEETAVLEQKLGAPDGTEISGFERKPLNAQIDNARAMLSSLSVSIWEFAKYATGYVKHGDPSTWDWAPATRAAMASIKKGEIWYPPEFKYKHLSGIRVNVRAIAIKSCGAVLDFSGIPEGQVAVTLFGSGVWSYLWEGSRGGIFGIEIRGAGPNSKTVGIEWVGADNISTPANSEVGNVLVNDFGVGILTSNHAYNITHKRGMVNRCKVGIAVRGTINSGERINLEDFVFSGCEVAVEASGGGTDLYLNNCSFDFNRRTLVSSAFKVEFNNTHVEFWNDGVDYSPFDVSGQGKFLMNGGVILGQRETTSYEYCISAKDTSHVILDAVRLHNINPTKGFDTGTGTVSIVRPMLNSISLVRALRKNGMLRDPGFELNDVAANTVYIGNFTGTRTSRVASTSLNISTSSAFAASGTYSLRVAKTAGSGSAASFKIMVPCQAGEQFNLQFKVLNPSMRSGALGVTQAFGSYSGNDSQGIPIVSQQTVATWAAISPTNSWSFHHDSLDVYASSGIDSIAPAWANVVIFEFNMFSFLGGSGAPEGGSYSLYFDEVNISKW